MSFYLLQVNNDIELGKSEGYSTFHTSSSLQSLATDTKDIYPSDVGIKKAVGGVYDNPTMIMKD